MLATSQASQQQSSSASPASEAAAATTDAVHVTFPVGERGYVTVKLEVGPAKDKEAPGPSSSKAEHRGMKPGAAQGKSCTAYEYTKLCCRDVLTCSALHFACAATIYRHEGSCAQTCVAEHLDMESLCVMCHSWFVVCVIFRDTLPKLIHDSCLNCLNIIIEHQYHLVHWMCLSGSGLILLICITWWCRATGYTPRLCGDKKDTAG